MIIFSSSTSEEETDLDVFSFKHSTCARLCATSSVHFNQVSKWSLSLLDPKMSLFWTAVALAVLFFVLRSVLRKLFPGPLYWEVRHLWEKLGLTMVFRQKLQHVTSRAFHCTLCLRWMFPFCTPLPVFFHVPLVCVEFLRLSHPPLLCMNAPSGVSLRLW